MEYVIKKKEKIVQKNISIVGRITADSSGSGLENGGLEALVRRLAAVVGLAAPFANRFGICVATDVYGTARVLYR